MLIKEIIEQAKKMISNRLEIEILLAHVFKKPREFLIAHPKARVSRPVYKRFINFCNKRKEGIPLAYITKQKEFFGLDFYVDPRVLIPRPETELLVEEVIKIVKKQEATTAKAGQGSKKQVLCDIGTGSGCITIALAKNLPHVKIIATDISRDALCVARKNAKKHHVSKRIKFIQSDLLERVMSFDIIIANLPYVPRKEALIVEREVKKYEPGVALWAGQDGFSFLKTLLQQVKNLRHPPRYLIAEFGFSMKKSLHNLIKNMFPKPDVIFKKDLAGLDRMFVLSLRAPLSGAKQSR